MTWLREKSRAGNVTAKEMAQPFLGPLGWPSGSHDDTRLSFFADAKAEDGQAWVGGFLEIVPGCQGPWFSFEVDRSWTPWHSPSPAPIRLLRR